LISQEVDLEKTSCLVGLFMSDSVLNYVDEKPKLQFQLYYLIKSSSILSRILSKDMKHEEIGVETKN